MKRMLALLLTVCLLLPASCAHAMTMEQMVFSVLPEMLSRAPEGFSLCVTPLDGPNTVAMAYDEAGQPILLWGHLDDEAQNLTGVKLETVFEALLCYAAGVDALPEDADADLSFLGETMQRLEQAVMQSVTVEESDIAQEDGSCLHQTDVTVRLKTLLTLVDAVVQAELTVNADAINAFLSGYGEVISGLLPGFPTDCDAATLLSLWQSMRLSSLMAVEMPLHIRIVSAGGLLQPWRVEASVAWMHFSAEFTGEYLAGELNTPMTYAFDSRDLGKLWTIVTEACDGLSEDALAYSAGNGDYLLRLNPDRLLCELEMQLYASIERHGADWDALLMRYLPWFGVIEVDVDEVTRAFRQQLSQTVSLMRRDRENSMRKKGVYRGLLAAVASIPSVELSLHTEPYALDFEGTFGGERAYVHLRNGSIDAMLPIPDYPVALTGMLTGNALNLSGRVGNIPYALTGVRADDLFTIDCYVDSEKLIVYELADSYLRAYSPDDPDQAVMLMWGHDSVQLTSSDGTLNALATADGYNASLTVQADGDIYAVRLRRGGMFGVEIETYSPVNTNGRRDSYDYANAYNSKRAELTLTYDALSAQYEEKNSYWNDTYIRKYSAEAGWTWENPYLRICSQTEGPYSTELCAFDYHPGSVSLIENGSSLHIFSDTRDATRHNQTHVVFDDSMKQYAWVIDTTLNRGNLKAEVSGDSALSVVINYGPMSITDEELAQIHMLDAHELLLLLGLAEPRITTCVGVAQGFAGPVTVSVGLNEYGEIASIDIGDESFAETQGLGAKVQEDAFREQFIGLTLPVSAEDIDGIAGATITTNAVLEALDAIARANGLASDDAAGEPEEAEPADEPAEAESVAPQRMNQVRKSLKALPTGGKD